MNLNNPKLAGFLRGVAYVVVMAIVTYLADPTHLTWLSGSAGTLVAAIFAAVDSQLQSKGHGALFGVVR